MVAYGKLFSKKAGLVSREWYPDLANYRRNGYDFDSRYEESLASYREKCVMDVLLREGPALSKDMKRMAGFGGDGLKGFDTVMTKDRMASTYKNADNYLLFWRFPVEIMHTITTTIINSVPQSICLPPSVGVLFFNMFQALFFGAEVHKQADCHINHRHPQIHPQRCHQQVFALRGPPRSGFQF